MLSLSKTWRLIFSGVLTLIFIFPSIALAGSIGFGPTGGEFAVGESFSVGVYVSSSDQSMNAASATIAFPSDLLEVTSLDQGGSIIQIWVTEPNFSNTTGTINFEGIILNPGFQGGSGKLITIHFRAKAPGEAAVNFLNGSILANDGKGSSILSGLGIAQFTIQGEGVSKPPEITKPEKTPLSVPSEAIISSSTHPDPEKWYQNSHAEVSWLLANDITGVSYLIDQNPITDPGRISKGVISTASKDLDDGIWYIHVRLKNSQGWSTPAHYALRTDRSDPIDLVLDLIKPEEETDPRVKLVMSAKDEVSGIDHFAISIDGLSPVNWVPDDLGYYQTEPLAPGGHAIIIKAVDKAGNTLKGSLEFEIGAIQTPLITNFPSHLNSGQPFFVDGTAIPNANIFVWVSEEGKESIRWITRSDHEGKIHFIADQGMRYGAYEFWLQAQDHRGALSPNSEVKSFTVATPGFFGYLIDHFELLLILFAILWVAIVASMWHMIIKFFGLKRRVTEESHDAIRNIHKAFNLLREDVQNEVAELEQGSNKSISKREKRIIQKLQQDLDGVEDFVEEKLHTIEDEVKSKDKSKKKGKKKK